MIPLEEELLEQEWMEDALGSLFVQEAEVDGPDAPRVIDVCPTLELVVLLFDFEDGRVKVRGGENPDCQAVHHADQV